MPSFNNDREYYRKLIVEHYTNPQRRGFKNLPHALTYHQASASCVDDFEVQVLIKAEIIISACFEGIGCAISTAATDIFCLLIENQTIDGVKKIINSYQAMLAKKPFDENIVGKLLAFKNVPRQSNRIKCALIGIDGINKLL